MVMVVGIWVSLFFVIYGAIKMKSEEKHKRDTYIAERTKWERYEQVMQRNKQQTKAINAIRRYQDQRRKGSGQ